MKFDSIFYTPTTENTYLVYDENTKNGAVIDPGCRTEDILKTPWILWSRSMEQIIFTRELNF